MKLTVCDGEASPIISYATVTSKAFSSGIESTITLVSRTLGSLFVIEVSISDLIDNYNFKIVSKP